MTALGAVGDGNAVNHAGVDPPAGAAKALWVEESGLFVVLTLIAAAILSRGGRWTVIRALPAGERTPVQGASGQVQPRVH